MRIAVAGGTGAIGQKVVMAATAAGHDTVILARSTGTDLTTGEGLGAAIDGADVVIDLAALATTSSKKSLAFFSSVTRNLLKAEREVGVGHHVAVSIIGAAKVDSNYYAGKAAQERILAGQRGGWTLLRSTQVHEFAAQAIEPGHVGPVQIVAGMRCQPLSSTELAETLLGLATGTPQGQVADLAGPKEERMVDLVRKYLAATGQSRPVLELPFPGAWGRGMRDGTLLPGPDAVFARQTFDEWLASLPR
jgi:uncharacterized protein YbjT (DUF2867 family)